MSFIPLFPSTISFLTMPLYPWNLVDSFGGAIVALQMLHSLFICFKEHFPKKYDFGFNAHTNVSEPIVKSIGLSEV